jgi:hypothetical protein
MPNEWDRGQREHPARQYTTAARVLVCYRLRNMALLEMGRQIKTLSQNQCELSKRHSISGCPKIAFA